MIGFDMFCDHSSWCGRCSVIMEVMWLDEWVYVMWYKGFYEPTVQRTYVLMNLNFEMQVLSEFCVRKYHEMNKCIQQIHISPNEGGLSDDHVICTSMFAPMSLKKCHATNISYAIAQKIINVDLYVSQYLDQITLLPSVRIRMTHHSIITLFFSQLTLLFTVSLWIP